MRIRKINKEKMEKEPEISKELIDKAVKIAEKVKRPEFVLFWLKRKAEESEEHFDSWLKFVQESSHQELINMIHELGNDGLNKFNEEFENKK